MQVGMAMVAWPGLQFWADLPDQAHQDVHEAPAQGSCLTSSNFFSSLTSWNSVN